MRLRGGGGVRRPLVLILALALVLRIASACVPMVAHPDEIYQYLEPAYRLLGGNGVVTWEWRVGMRSWLLPMLLAGPVAIGRAIGGEWGLLLPRMTVAIAALAIPAAAWGFGARLSRLHAIAAALVAATWFELLYFAGRTLSEPLATAAIFPAAYVLTDYAPRRRWLFAAGALLGFAVVLRPHYAVACAVLVLASSGRRLRTRALPLIAGGCLVAAATAMSDVAMGATPFAWVIENFRQNVIENRAAHYGTAPILAYIAFFLVLWRWWTIPMLVAMRFGYARAPVLFWTGFANLVVHSAIGHKEYRFIFLTIALFVTVAALGSIELVRIAQKRWPQLPGAVLPAGMLALWMAASIALGASPRVVVRWNKDRAGTELFTALKAENRTCGVALVQPPAFAEVPGAVALPDRAPISLFMRNDPQFAAIGRRAALAQHAGDYDRIVAPARLAGAMPPGYAETRCAHSPDGPLCIFARAGRCTPEPASPYRASVTLERLSM